jgi:RNA polymerase primary sigma factor
MIRLPVHANDIATTLQRARATLENRLGRTPTLVELCNETELPFQVIEEAMLFQHDPLSLSEPVADDAEASLGDLIEDHSALSPEEEVSSLMLSDEVERLLQPLNQRERDVLTLRFGLDRGEPRTLEEVGERFDLTRERIRQIEARAMSKLRHPCSGSGVRELMMTI